MKTGKKILIVCSGAIAALFFTAGIAFALLTKGVVLDESKLSLCGDEIVIYDDCGETAKTFALGDKKGAYPLSDVPQHVINAFIDAEDKRFFKHGGVDILRIIRATANNIKSHSFKEGASTISQQLIKNTHLTQEKTIKRKLQELKLTFALENKYSKEEILEKYLDSIYFGHDCFGLKSAARFYFNKRPDELTLSEGATIAGLVKSPNNYSPFKAPVKCKKRRNTVLRAMEKAGHITNTERESAENEPLPTKSASIENAAGSYFARVYDELERLTDENNLHLKGKIGIYTYLNADLQNALCNLLSDVTKGGNEANTSGIAEKCDAIGAVLSNDSCGFSAYYSTCGDCKRSPASLFKPLCVYAPAFEEGLISPATPILDEPTDFGGYSPKNYAEKYYGYVSVREAIEKSLNVPAVKTLNALSVKKSTEYLKAEGLGGESEEFSLAAALGGTKNGYTLTQLIGAYAIFPRGGTYLTPAFIKKITVDGKTAYDAENGDRAAERRVFSESCAALTTDVLQSCAKYGTAKKLRDLPFDIAAKTGTNGDKNGNVDAYALGYTPKHVAAVWLGNADNTKISATGGGVPCNKLRELILAAENDRLYKNEKTENASGAKIRDKERKYAKFAICEGVKKAALDKDDYENDRRLTLADPLAPEQYKVYEIFDERYLPNERSTKFSEPQISMPKIVCKNDKVEIRLTERAPDYYEYRIERCENGQKITVYKGKKKSVFFDEIESGKNYEYFVTPLYGEREGKTIALPKITTKTNELSPISPKEPPKIVDKDWWED